MTDEPAPKVHLFQRRRPLGAARMVETPEELVELATGYFQWAIDNPLEEQVLVSYQGVTSKETKAKMRAVTINGLCLYIGILPGCWRQWRANRDDLKPVIEWAEAYIYNSKIEGAAADLLNSVIIARELGLSDKREVTGNNGGALRLITTDMSAKEAAEAYADTLNG